MYVAIKPETAESKYLAIVYASGSCDCCKVNLDKIGDALNQLFDHRPVKGMILVDNLASIGMSSHRFFIYRNYNSEKGWDTDKLRIVNKRSVDVNAINQLTKIYCSDLSKFAKNAVLSKDQIDQLRHLGETLGIQQPV